MLGDGEKVGSGRKQQFTKRIHLKGLIFLALSWSLHFLRTMRRALLSQAFHHDEGSFLGPPAREPDNHGVKALKL